MILPDWQIKEWATRGGVEPHIPENVNPASIDLRIGNEFVDLQTGKRFFQDELTLVPGAAILATTMEYVKIPRHVAGVLYLKSSLARQGLDHALAGWVDPGFEGQLTMELHAHREVVLTAGQRVVQLVLIFLAATPDVAYQGRYQGQRGPTAAR